jgi:hypothetical protein
MNPRASRRRPKGARLTIDHTRWMAAAIEILAIAAAVAFAYLHTGP